MSNIICFCISGILAIWFGFFAFEKGIMLTYYKDSVYWFLTINICLWLLSIAKIYSSQNLASKEYLTKIYSFFKNHWIALAVSLVLMVTGTICCKPEFRIFADEINLLSDSQNLYEARECYTTHSLLEYSNGNKIILAAVLDKRPAFFPYLVSIIHLLSGYKPENVFVLNFIIGFISLFLVYYIIQLFFEKYWGIIGTICLASYPLFIRYTNSGGFEVFNMMCSLVFFICLYNFIKKPDALRTETLLLFVPLLTQSRYESVLALFIALPLVFYILPRKEYSCLSYKFIVFPLLLIAPAWLRLITNNAESWQVDSLEGGFGINWLFINIKKALIFYFSGNSNYGINYILSYFAAIGFIWFIYNLITKKPLFNQINTTDENNSFSCKTFWIFVFLFYALHALIRFIYSWIALTNPVINRLGIVFLPLLVMMSIYSINQFTKYFKYSKALIIIPLILVFIPGYWSYIYNNESTPYLDFYTCKNFLEKYYPNKKDYLIIHYKSNLYTPFGYSSVGYQYFNKPEIKNLISNYYSQKECAFFLAFQIADLKTNKAYDFCNIPNKLLSEIIFETKINNAYILRISKCTPTEE